jgi:CheY-like chemotaxis protein
VLFVTYNPLCLFGEGRGMVALDLPIVLVVEDDQLLQGLVEDTLSEGGFETVIAASGEEALTQLQGHERKIPRDRDRHQSRRQDRRLGSRPARERDRAGVSRRLHERGCCRRLDLQRRSEQHHVGQAICAGPASHCRFEPSQ